MTEWFQNTQTGLVRSSVSSRTCSTRTGLSRGLGSGAPSLYTTALTTGVLMTGRLGSLGWRGENAGKDALSGHSSKPTHGRREHPGQMLLPRRARAVAAALSLTGRTRGTGHPQVSGLQKRKSEEKGGTCVKVSRRVIHKPRKALKPPEGRSK